MTDDPMVMNDSADPSRFKIGATSAARLASLSGVATEKLTDLTISDATKQFAHLIDPQLFLFHKICGTVVKTDPVTGTDFPVPFATVQVEDTDCSFLGYFPVNSPWSWYFPFRCHREVIATAKTDACGNFCVWVPRWDIDWVVRWRLQRKCFPIIFERPNLHDLIDQIIPQQVPPIPRGPGDPGPRLPIDRGQLVDRIASSFGRTVGTKLNRLLTPATFGTNTTAVDAALVSPALLPHIRPPLPAEIHALDVPQPAGLKDAPSPTSTLLANRLSLDPSVLKAVDMRRYIGPFKRCFDVIFPEWTPIIDVPDITFRVLQDTDGDGVEEQIYGETYFQVRWDAGNIGPVTLHAGPNAKAAPLCGPTNIPCGDVPAIVTAGRLPVTGDPSTYDAATGYAVRTNRPHPSGTFGEVSSTPAQSPLAGVLALYGCAKTDPTATHYRLVFRYSPDRGVTFTSPTPFTNFTWPLYRLNGSGIGEWYVATPDALGWYPIALPAGPNPWLPEDLLLDWPTGTLADGLYAVTLQVGTGGAVSQSSAEVAFTIDNSAPTGLFQVAAGTSPGGPFTPIDGVCPVVRRGVVPHDLYFQVTLHAAAHHFRSVELSASGCGAGSFQFESGSGGVQEPAGGTTFHHWHTAVTDNDDVMQVIYKLPSTALEGTYSFGGDIWGRAFNPDGGDGGQLAVPPWEYSPGYVHITPSVAFSVFNSN
ncbi:hypothetical protein KX816_16000 [Sphingosinicellaceae bacterium]|nr:hypothetical protein KX816_16000 [Sphingosinicellaceae bacterium]